MKELIKNVEINSEILNNIKEKKQIHLTDMNHLKKEVLRQNSLLHYIETFEKSPFFENIIVEK